MSPYETVEFGNGEVAQLIRDRDWSQSPLGSPYDWPQELRTLVSVMLHSKFPMFAAWGPDLIFIYNDAYSEILGRKHPEALGRKFYDIWAEIWPDISPIIDRALAGEPSFFEDLPLTMQRKGYEEQTYFTFSYSPVYGSDRKVAGMYCACTETTQHVLAERQRTNEIDRLRTLFQQAPGIIAVMRNADHTFEVANEAYLELVGHRDIVGKPLREALPELEGQGFFELLDDVFDSGEAYRGHAVPVQLQRRTSETMEIRYVDFVYQPIVDASGTVTGIFVEGSDVTEAVLTTQALRESEQRLRQLANTIPHLAWMANPDGYVHWFNDRFFEYTGATQEEVEGWQWLKLLPAESRFDSATFEALFASGEAFEMRAPLRAANGEYRTFYTKAAPLHDSAGKIVQWFGTNTDIHEIERVQQDLRTSNRRKDEFLAMLAHELRNPLAPIATSAEILNLPDADRERIRSTSEVISRQVEHMNDLLDDLLDVSRVTRGQVKIHKEATDLVAVLQGAIEQVRHLLDSKGQEFTASLPPESVVVHGDKTRLVQVFSNVLNNAARYTQAKGCISLNVSLLPECVEVTVRDNGIGIAAELLPNVFDIFTQAERSPDRSLGGLGLGLALVKSLVLLHNGTVVARSDGADEGSEFTVSLPLLEQTGLQDNVSEDRELIGSTRYERVLIVDDNVDAARSLAILLESHDYECQVCFTAKDALQVATDFQPEAIILDIGLPDIDGHELAGMLKKLPETANALLIALTGYGQRRDRQESSEAGFSHHLVKPANLSRLLAILSRPE
ncbi:PAS domain-containing protein [Proteobacteria bacterium 005FR1]|nr:PAS domain-containing protein [Proteobacteria bacterium 005FR1]